jgi:hypothetical protein
MVVQQMTGKASRHDALLCHERRENAGKQGNFRVS